MGNIEKLIGLYGSNGFSVGDSLLWSDLFIFDVTSQIFGNELSILDDFSNIKAVRASVEANANVAEYLKNRKDAAF